MPLLLAALAAVLTLAGPAAAQQWPAKFKKAAPAAREPRNPAEAQAAKREMFDAACGDDVDLEQSLGMLKRFPELAKDWNQDTTLDCWAYTGCMGIEYYRRNHGGEATAQTRCDPMMTAVAVKLGTPGALVDKFDEKGVHQTQFVASDSFGSFPEKLKKSKFGSHKGVEELCKPNGCYCARAMDQDIPGPRMLDYYYKAQEIVLRHFKEAYARRSDPARFSPFNDQDQPKKLALRVAADLDSAGLPGIIRSSLDDATLARLAELQQLRLVALDNRTFAETILKQSCLPVPFPAVTLSRAKEVMDDKDRTALATDPLAGRKKMGSLFDYINGKLKANTPVMIGFCSSLFDYKNEKDPTQGDYVGVDPPAGTAPAAKANAASTAGGGGCGNHNVVVIGRKKIGGRCYLGIRNSWGSFTPANPELRSGAPGTVWIPAYLLLQNTFDAGAYE